MPVAQPFEVQGEITPSEPSTACPSEQSVALSLAHVVVVTKQLTRPRPPRPPTPVSSRRALLRSDRRRWLLHGGDDVACRIHDQGQPHFRPRRHGCTAAHQRVHPDHPPIQRPGAGSNEDGDAVADGRSARGELPRGAARWGERGESEGDLKNLTGQMWSGYDQRARARDIMTQVRSDWKLTLAMQHTRHFSWELH